MWFSHGFVQVELKAHQSLEQHPQAVSNSLILRAIWRQLTLREHSRSNF